MKTQKLVGTLLLMIILNSCAMQKRHYLNGYSIHWHNNNQARVEKLNNKTTTNIDSTDLSENIITATITNDDYTTPVKIKKQLTLNYYIPLQKMEHVVLTKKKDTIDNTPPINGSTKAQKQINTLSVISIVLGILALIMIVAALGLGAAIATYALVGNTVIYTAIAAAWAAVLFPLTGHFLTEVASSKQDDQPKNDKLEKRIKLAHTINKIALGTLKIIGIISIVAVTLILLLALKFAFS